MTQEAVDFLLRWRPGGPWVLSVKIVGKGFHTTTFHKDQVEEMARWIESHNGKSNLYFSINPTFREMSSKAGREDIAALEWLHVDLDPRAGEDVAQEQERIAHLLSDRLPKGIPTPTVVIDSGGGRWGFWRLREPLRLDGTLALAEDAKLYNLQLERLFGADHCHNIDRVARLPGTTNIPDDKKIKAGRKIAPATVVEFNDEDYELKEFKQAPPMVQSALSATLMDQPAQAATLDIGGNIERISDFSELAKYELPNRFGVIMAQGHLPDSPKEKDNSRSAWLFDFACGLARHKVPDETIYSIITDPDWAISSSILDKGSAAHNHALRTIQRAKDYAIDPLLEEMNRQFAVIESFGGKVRVIEEQYDRMLGRSILTKQTFDDFKNRFMHRSVEVPGPNGPTQIPRGHWWLKHPQRRQYKRVMYDPNGTDPDVYNLWRGFAFEPKEGDCSLYLQHLKENICGGNEEHFKYLIGWMAYGIQNPHLPGEVAIVMKGEQGTGKGVCANVYGKLWGRHFVHLTDTKHLTGSFNAHLRDIGFIHADEAHYAGDKKTENVLKALITEAQHIIEAKGVDAETAPNCSRMMMSSNHDWVVPVGKHDRRFFVLEVANNHRQDRAYFKAIMEQMKNGGYEALLYHLSNVDLSDFDLAKFPRTKAMMQQRDFTMSPEESWYYEKLKNGRLLPSVGFGSEVQKNEMIDDWVEYARRFNIQRRATETSLGMMLQRYCPSIKTRQRMGYLSTDARLQGGVKSRVYIWDFPPLERARAEWEERYGAQDWPEVHEEPEHPELLTGRQF